MLVPFLSLLFGKDELVSSAPDFSFHYDTLIQYLNYQISQIIIEKGEIDALIFICLFLLFSFFLRNLFRFFAMVLLAIIRGGAIKNIRDDVYKKILILPLSFYSKRKKGDVIARITTDVQEVEVSILNNSNSVDAVRQKITKLTEQAPSVIHSAPHSRFS